MYYRKSSAYESESDLAIIATCFPLTGFCRRKRPAHDAGSYGDRRKVAGPCVGRAFCCRVLRHRVWDVPQNAREKKEGSGCVEPAHYIIAGNSERQSFVRCII
ncbi:hypothetical protein EVAR_29445_1 [Eumeta japonica]|uniref:Uncharacterized protein n=1 Tax=Eumeta variegata TaxID=151549 RepID=A0A4C1VU99_EUMVA|nr:hypothetical protein EVAR_29445_1 [Eumeta japonica]